MPLRGEAPNRATYQNLVPIGPGASETYTADHSIFGDNVVQKTIPERAVLPDAVVLHEPRLLKSLEHRAIPQIHEAQFDPIYQDRVVMVMEKVGAFDGGAVVLGQQPPLSVGELLAVASDLLGALDHLHVTASVLHRDVKPDNLRLSENRRRAWLIDLNMSGQIGPDGTVAGVATPAPWMAPEVPITQRYSVHSEIYSLGVVLYELLLGRQMLDGYPMDQIDARVTSGRRGFPDAHFRRWPPHVPDRLRRVITKAFATDPADRWGNAAEMRAALGRLVVVDWSAEAQGRWTGTWPSNRARHKQIDVEVKTRTLRGGPDRGNRRATARYRPTTSWRRLPELADRVVDSDADLAQFFADAERRLATLRPST